MDNKIVDSIIHISLNNYAVAINTTKPFLWSSGYYMPVYNNNRVLMSIPDARAIIIEACNKILLDCKINKDNIDGIIGVATAGIGLAAILAHVFNKRFYYFRSAKKNHGTMSQIEGMNQKETIKNKNLIVIDDLISTGGSACKAVAAFQQLGANISLCMSIYSYDFFIAKKNFNNLNCDYKSIVGMKHLINFAHAKKIITNIEYEEVNRWIQDPFTWGDSKGFKKINNAQ